MTLRPPLTWPCRFLALVAVAGIAACAEPEREPPPPIDPGPDWSIPEPRAAAPSTAERSPDAPNAAPDAAPNGAPAGARERLAELIAGLSGGVGTIGAAPGPSSGQETAAVHGTLPVQLQPGDTAGATAGLRTYILATDPVSVPEASLAAAVCAWRYGRDVAPPQVGGTEGGDLTLLILPVRELQSPNAAPAAFTAVYDHARARQLLAAAGVRREGLLLVTVTGPPLSSPPPEGGARGDLLIEDLTGWSPGLGHAWVSETRRRVRQPGGWSRQSLEQRLLAVAAAFDMAGSFVGPYVRLVGTANAESRAPELPAPCR